MKKIKVMLAKVGLDGHDRGMKVIAMALRDAGMEVIYTGLRKSCEQVVNLLIQEKADILGLSFLSGDHMTHMPRLIELLKKKKMSDIPVIVGGIINKDDILHLKNIGVAEVFLPGTPTEEIIKFIITNTKRG